MCSTQLVQPCIGECRPHILLDYPSLLVLCGAPVHLWGCPLCARNYVHHPTVLWMQEGVKVMLKKHGMDINLLSCCVVSQTCLALDARDPVELINSLQKLLGTWHLQQVQL